MHTIMRTTRFAWTHIGRAILGTACLVAASACSSDSSTSPTQNDDAARAVSVFTQLADSVSRNGGDADIGSAYASLAEAVRVGGRISPIVITVDDVPTTFYATALQTDIDVLCPGDQFCTAVPHIVSLRTLIAWQQNDPRRVMQLSSETNGDPIRAYIFPTFAPFVGKSASLTFFDGKGGIYFGTSGAQKFDITKSAVACAATSDKPTIAIFPAPPHCTQSDFFVTFNGKAEPSSFLSGKNNATGSHTFSMSSQQILGARFELTAQLPPLPPIVVTPSASLPATLTAKVDSLVTLTLTVSNPTSSPVKIEFSSGQHYDFTIYDASTGLALWVWSADKLFMQALSSETIPANGKLVYTAEWKPTKSGSFVATGSLVSLSHRATTKAAVSVP
jgi:hypothetical protein